MRAAPPPASPPSRRLEGQVALVTGAGTGIGAAIALRLGQEGAHVAVNVRSRDAADDVLARLHDAGAEAIAVVGDVAVETDPPRLVAECVARFGRLDIAVSNAGTQEERPFLELDLASWRRQTSVDLDGVFLVGHAAARQMAAQGRGTIVNITSVHERTTRPGFAAYCSAKAGAGMLTRCMGRELAPLGIRVVAVAPGAIATAMQVSADEQEVLSGIPAGRLARPDEVATLVAWLASPEAAYITATTIVMDGGLEQETSLS